jgi:phage terminase small subunit
MLPAVPAVSIAAKLAQHLTRLEQEFGMPPSARTRIQVTQPDPASELRDFIRRGQTDKSRFFRPA